MNITRTKNICWSKIRCYVGGEAYKQKCNWRSCSQSGYSDQYWSCTYIIAHYIQILLIHNCVHYPIKIRACLWADLYWHTACNKSHCVKNTLFTYLKFSLIVFYVTWIFNQSSPLTKVIGLYMRAIFYLKFLLLWTGRYYSEL